MEGQEDVATLAQVQSSARERLSQLSSGQEATPAAQPEAIPAPDVAPPAPTQAPPTEPTLEAQPAVSAPPPAVDAAPAAPVELPALPAIEPTPEETAELMRLAEGVLRENIEQDREAQAWVAEWSANEQRISELGADLVKGGAGAIAKLERELIKAEGQLETDFVQQDEFAKSSIQQRIRDLKSDVRELRGERFDRTQEDRDLAERYKARHEKYRTDVLGRVRAAQEAKSSEARIEHLAVQFKAQWDASVPRIGAARGVPTESMPAFEERAREAIDVHLNRTGPIADLDAFLTKQADRYVGEMDANHRAKSAQYARTVVARAGQPAPPAGVAPPAVAEPFKAPETLNDVYKRTRMRLDQFRRGA